MLFSLTNPEIAILMMGIFLFAVLLGFPIAFTLMAMGVGFGYYAYFDPTRMEHIFDNRIFQLFVQNFHSPLNFYTYLFPQNPLSFVHPKLDLLQNNFYKVHYPFLRYLKSHFQFQLTVLRLSQIETRNFLILF